MNEPMTEAQAESVGNYRWTICGLLFLATTVNYVDRNSLSVLKTTLQSALGWSEADYGWIAFAFTAAYAIFPVLAGRMIDRLGVKRGFAIGVILWSVMCMAHGLVQSVIGFAIVRFLLGAAEATNFPAAIKAISQWFPQKERALANGLFNCGTNFGVMISFSVVWLSSAYGWRVGLRHHRSHRVPLARPLVARLRTARRAPQGLAGGARLHPVGPGGVHREGAGPLDQAAPIPGDLAVPHHEVPDGPGLVVLPLLAPVVSRARARSQSDE